MGTAFELTPPTDLRIARQDEDVLELRTGVGSWWLGTLGLIALLGVLVGGIGSFAYALWHLRFLAAISSLVGTALASAFLALFAGALLHERLFVTRTEVIWTLQLFSFKLRCKRMAYADITNVEVVDVGNDDGLGYNRGQGVRASQGRGQSRKSGPTAQPDHHTLDLKFILASAGDDSTREAWTQLPRHPFLRKLKNGTASVRRRTK